jgi:hypothetical protein
MFVVEMYGVPNKEPEKRWFDCGHRVWEDAIKLGKKFGWQPMGTVPAPSSMEAWIKAGSYKNDYEPYMWGYEMMVMADDAKAWAEALERALADMDDKSIASTSKPGAPIISDTMQNENDFKHVNDGSSRSRLREFIDFMKKGGFAFTWDD